MKFKGLVFMFFVLVLIGFSISSVFAISAAIGNGRMILRGDVGDNVERYVNVINQNDFDVVINISVSGDLENYVSLVDESFILSAGEERKAYFNFILYFILIWADIQQVFRSKQYEWRKYD